MVSRSRGRALRSIIWVSSVCRVPAVVAGVAYLGPISLLRSDAPSDADEAFTSENWIVSLLACLDSCMWFSFKILLSVPGPYLPGQEGRSFGPRPQDGERVRQWQKEEEVEAPGEAKGRRVDSVCFCAPPYFIVCLSVSALITVVTDGRGLAGELKGTLPDCRSSSALSVFSALCPIIEGQVTA